MYFFDSYAFFEILKDNPNYEEYKQVPLITTKMNLMEVYYWILLRQGKEMAEKVYTEFVDFCIEITDEIIKKACEFRIENKKKELSYVDCLGYVIARERNIKFLTGDEGFKDIINVEFIK